MNIELHIERLILDGVAVEPHGREEVKAAVVAELTRLLKVNGLRAELLSSKVPFSPGTGEIQVTRQTAPAQLGNQIARAVHGGIGARY